METGAEQPSYSDAVADLEFIDTAAPPLRHARR